MPPVKPSASGSDPASAGPSSERIPTAHRAAGMRNEELQQDSHAGDDDDSDGYHWVTATAESDDGGSNSSAQEHLEVASNAATTSHRSPSPSRPLASAAGPSSARHLASSSRQAGASSSGVLSAVSRDTDASTASATPAPSPTIAQPDPRWELATAMFAFLEQVDLPANEKRAAMDRFAKLKTERPGDEAKDLLWHVLTDPFEEPVPFSPSNSIAILDAAEAAQEPYYINDPDCQGPRTWADFLAASRAVSERADRAIREADEAAERYRRFCLRQKLEDLVDETGDLSLLEGVGEGSQSAGERRHGLPRRPASR